MRKEIRKHFSQMTPKEKRFIDNRIDKKRAMVSPSNLNVGSHANKRIEDRNRLKVSLALIVDTIKNSNFHEYKLIREGDKIVDERVLLRSKGTYDGHNIIIVYSLMFNRVITFWTNYPNDKKATLDMSIYDKNMKIVGVVQ